jgi:hypothetical protein
MSRPLQPLRPARRPIKIAGATPREHAQRAASPRAQDLFGTWAKLAAEPFRGITTDGRVQPGLFQLEPADAPVAQMAEAVRAAARLAPDQRARRVSRRSGAVAALAEH